MTDQNKPMPKVPRPARAVGAIGNGSSSAPPPPLPPRPEAIKESAVESPPSSVPAPRSQQVTQVAPSAPPPAGNGAVGAAGLKVVTISPGRISFSDAEGVPSSRLKALRQDPYLGATIDGRYKVEAVLGEGGMGVVYRCVHTIIGKRVAMKVLRADLARDTEVTERFLNEAKSASSIGNAHIIDISDFGQFHDGSTYFVMEFLVGQPLTKLVEGGHGVPLPRILNIARQLAEGLAAAHAVNIVHRDLKPDNIFLIDRGGEKDFVKILDFGIAKVSTSGEAAKLTRAGAVFGTPHYMSPEQAAGQPVDHRGDVYSVGVILYELASGRVPFDADNFMGILTQHIYKAPPPLRTLPSGAQEVPPGLEAIVLKCLSKRPEHRYQSMGGLLADLDKLRGGAVPSAVPEMMSRSGGFSVPANYFAMPGTPEPAPAPPESGRERRQWPLLAGVAGVAAAVVILGGVLANGSVERAQPSAAASTEAQPSKPASSTPAPGARAKPATKQVALAVIPPEAHVYDGDQDLGTSPVLLTVEEGKPLKLSARMSGYKELALVIDGSSPRERVTLERLPGVKSSHATRASQPKNAATEPAKAEPKKKGGMGNNEIVNPWD